MADRFGEVIDPEGRRYQLRPRDCPICGPGDKAALGIRGGRFHRYGLGIESPIVRCRQCSLLFPDPFPHPLDTQTMYGDPDKYFELHGEFDGKAQAQRSTIREIKQRTAKADPSILDIGSGRGELLRAAALEGITTAVGLEVSDAMIAKAAAHGLTVLAKTAECYADTAGRRFDAVVLSAVAEHVEDPDSLLGAVARLARPGAVLLIDLPREPNIVTMAAKVAATLRRSEGVLNLSPTFSPFHVYGFNPKSLKALLTKRGFRLEHLLVRAAPLVPHNGTMPDRLGSIAAGALIRLGNRTGTAPNMTAWARRD